MHSTLFEKFVLPYTVQDRGMIPDSLNTDVIYLEYALTLSDTLIIIIIIIIMVIFKCYFSGELIALS